MLRFAIRAAAVGFGIVGPAPASAPILMLLGCLVALARASLLGVERVILIYWYVLTN